MDSGLGSKDVENIFQFKKGAMGHNKSPVADATDSGTLNPINSGLFD